MQQAVIINPSDLDRFISEMRVTFVEELTKAKSQVIEKPLTRGEAAAYLSISTSALDRRVKNGSIPTSLVHYNGGTTYFFASELNRFLKQK